MNPVDPKAEPFASAPFPCAIQARIAGRPAYLIVIQNFRRSAGYNAAEIADDFDTACSALSGTGQRYPGFVLELAQVLDASPAIEDPRIVDAFTLRIGTPVVLVWLPELNMPSRCEVSWVGTTAAELASTPIVLQQVGCAAVAGVVRYISSSEDGPFAGYRQTRRDGIGEGID